MPRTFACGFAGSAHGQCQAARSSAPPGSAVLGCARWLFRPGASGVPLIRAEGGRHPRSKLDQVEHFR